MAIWYTDVATNQIQGANFPGFPGQTTLTTQPGSENNPLFEGPPEILATYTWTGSEAANDIINIAVLVSGLVVRPGAVASGTTAPATTLTVAIGDNDLNYVATALPVPNPQAIISQPGGYNSPLWVSGTTYVRGNVVTDAASTPANQTFTCITASVSGSTAPSSDATNWIANSKRYSGSINIAGASGNVAFAAGTQLYGGPASLVPASVIPGTAQTGLTANQILNQQYQIQYPCWLQALILTCSSPVAGTVSVFRVPVVASN